MQSRQARKWRLLILFGIAVLLVAFGVIGREVYTNKFAQPTSVEIIRQKHGQLKRLDITVTNAETVSKLYSELKSLKTFPKGTMFCPMDWGVNYLLKFKVADRVLLTANADPSGCQEIRLSNGKRLWGVGTDANAEAFWNTLSSSIGLSTRQDLVGSSIS